MVKRSRRAVRIEEASSALYSRFKPLYRQEKVALSDALGRVLGVDIKAPMDVPPFDRASMDGYATRAADTYGASEGKPVSLKSLGYIAAGTPSKIVITAGKCSGIATGAPMPKGANCVVMVEHAEKSDGEIRISRPAHPGENVMRAGADIRKGEKILAKGTVLTPRETGVLAALGIDAVKVLARPRVAIISTGTELVEPGEPLVPGKIYDVNARSITDVVKGQGCIPEFLGVARGGDELWRLLKGTRHDVVITTGGTSVGEEDVSRAVIEKLGEVLVHGLAVKPGKPTLLADIRGKPFIGLPGYPTSALVVFYVLVAPFLRHLAGLPRLEPRKIRARLASRVFSARGRREYLPVSVANGLASPILKGSGAITTLAGADGFVEIPERVEILEEGSEVDVVLFQ